MIIGHRGAAALAPENTLSGINKAADIGIDWIEIDTQLSLDAVPVIFHDETIDRCSNGEGKLATLTLSELKALDFGAWFSDEFSNEKIATLAEVLVLCRERSLSINLEIKVHHDDQAQLLVQQVAKVIAAEHFPKSQLLLSSFSVSALEHCQRVMPEIRRGFLTSSSSSECLTEVEHLDLYSVHADQATLTEEMALVIGEKGLELMIWTLNDPSKKNVFKAMNVSGIITDDPNLFMGNSGEC